MVEIIPAILTDSVEEFNSMMRSAEGHFSKVHLDIADGIFVPNTTIEGMDALEQFNTPLYVIAHLMISMPERVLERWLRTKAGTFIFHIEATSKMEELVDKTHNAGKKVGLALNPSTPIETIAPFIGKVDFVQFMTVDPGFYGSEFRENVLNKIKNFKQEYPDIKVWVDGGINPATAKRVFDAGAEVFAVGSYFFGNSNGKDIDEAVENMKKSIQ